MMLPEACVANILAFTSPADALSSSEVSSVFRLAGDSDFVWGKFLPFDYQNIISQSTDHHRSFSSKKEIYRCLCDSLLIDNARKLFKINKFSGKISYILSARDISITYSDHASYWSWSNVSDSRFSESAELITTDRLEIKGTIQTGVLSPNTKYGAYLIMKVTEGAYGLDLVPAETSVLKSKSGQNNKNTTYLCCLDEKKQQMKRLFYGNREERMAMTVETVVGDGKRREPKGRDDGWMEIELGEFETREGEDGEVMMSLTEVKGYQLKGGIVIDGIEVRPRDQDEYSIK
ncbi:Phloem protein 2-like [Arabidopsis thaliana x Arabidopsis arenosa]|uniref:Phloem protein 2-like n=1 Tax=Arabidopsis thaliana x Arabidopsis arenosa TaxID=1240361 RepID=A0A8T2BG98_9BRAS|nr:Phloem protein 2-like [Arabidopsis thaliana x Arabidopsis arenosa]